MASASRLLSRVSWGLSDQALSSITNFAVSALVARQLGAELFGAFSLAFATYLVVLNVGRSLGTEPHAVRYSGAADVRWEQASRRMLGLSVVVGCVGAGAVLVVGLVVDGPIGQAHLALAPVLPGLLLQDGWRFVFFSSGRGRSAFFNDLWWTLALVPAFALVLALEPTVTTATLAWGGAATVAAFAGIAQARFTPRPSAAVAWLREHHDLGLPYLGETLSLNGTKQFLLYAITGIVGLAAAGAFRAGEVLLGPLRTVYFGLIAVAVPEAVRESRVSARRFRRLCRTLAAVLVLGALTITALLTVTPDELGRLVLGETWDVAAPLLVPLGIAAAGNGMMIGAQVGLRVLEASRRGLRSRLLSSLLVIALALVGTVIAGVSGTAVGYAIGAWVGALYWWQQLTTELHRVTGARAAALDEPLPDSRVDRPSDVDSREAAERLAH